MSMNISRRSFMKGAAAASLAVAASTMLTGCDMPNFDFGGIFGGNRTRTIKLEDGTTVNIALTGYSYDAWFGQARTEFKIVNNLKSNLKITDTKPSAAGYYLYVDYDAFGNGGAATGFDPDNSPLLEKEIAAEGNVTEKLTLDMDTNKDWTEIKLIFTVYNGNQAVSDPVEFSFK